MCVYTHNTRKCDHMCILGILVYIQFGWLLIYIYIHTHTHTYIYIYTYTCRHIIYINILDAGSLACFNLGVYATRPQNTEQRNTMEDPEQRWWGFPQVIVGQVHQNSSPVLMQRRTICMETGNSTLIFDVFQYAYTLYIIYIMRCKRSIPPQVQRPEQVMRQSHTRHHPLSCFPILTVCIAMAALA